MKMQKKYIRDPIYGFIEIKDQFLKIIDNPLFQRLRYIKQNGLGYLTFPSMTHTRFEHSLGVFELTKRLLEWIRKNVEKENMLDKSRIELIEEHKEGILTSALLHDIGHLPFSHALEKALVDESHESIGIFLIENTLIHEENIDRKLLEDALKILKRVYMKEKLKGVSEDELVVLKFSKQLLGSQMDVDRMDFLMRDSYHSGVQYGRFDVERLLRVIITLGGYLAVSGPPERSVPIVEEFILSRYEMYRQVYNHKSSEAYNGMLKLLVRKLKDHERLKLEMKAGKEPVIEYSIDFRSGDSFSGEIEFRYFDDPWVLHLMKSITRKGIALEDNKDRKIIEDLAGRILRREHYRVAYTIEGERTKFREALYSSLVRRQEEMDRVLYPQGSFTFADKIRGYEESGQEDEEEGEEILIIGSKGMLEPISRYSRLLKNVARSIVPIFRIYHHSYEKLPEEVVRIIKEAEEEANTYIQAE